MSEDQITGSVSVEDGTKAPEDYGVNRKVNVQVSFAGSAVGLEAFLYQAATQADRTVAKLLGRAPVVQSARPGDQPSTQGTSEAEQIANEAPAKKRGRPPVAKPDPSAVESPQPEADGATPSPSADPSAIEDPGVQVEVAPAPSAESPADPAAIEDWEVVAAPVIDDATLAAKVSARNGALTEKHGAKAAVAIRALITTFNPDPTRAFTLREIASAQRADFLAKLADLTID